MKVALVHDWLTGMRGGEKCLEVFCELFPEADLFTLLHVRGTVSPTIENRRIFPSFVQRLPFSARGYPYYLPLMPAAIESFDLNGYDLVLSSSHCVAKGAIPAPEALHVCYVHTPMRYAWDLRSRYFPPGRLLSRLAPPLLHYLRTWDVAATARADRMVANSRFVARRIASYYRREATVIHPPVDTEFFRPAAGRGEFYLYVGALAPHKGVELAVRAFNRLRRPLRIAGRGPLRPKLERLAGPTIEFTGWLSDEALREQYAACRAVVFPSKDDFGIVPLEANSMGRPVIALGQGGALETVVPANGRPELGSRSAAGDAEPPTGVLFHDDGPEALQAAVEWFERHEWLFRQEALREHARRFDRALFKRRIRRFLQEAIADRRSRRAGGLKRFEEERLDRAEAELVS